MDEDALNALFGALGPIRLRRARAARRPQRRLAARGAFG